MFSAGQGRDKEVASAAITEGLSQAGFRYIFEIAESKEFGIRDIIKNRKSGKFSGYILFSEAGSRTVGWRSRTDRMDIRRPHAGSI